MFHSIMQIAAKEAVAFLAQQLEEKRTKCSNEINAVLEKYGMELQTVSNTFIKEKTKS